MTRKSIRWLMISVFALTLGASMAPAAKKPPARNRQKHQAARIHQGAQSGSLTKRETHKLRHQQQAIHASIVRDRIDGGVFTPKERAKAQVRLNQQSRRIYRQKHDRQTR